MLCMVASLIKRISFGNGDYFGKPILGEMRLCSRFIRKFSDRLLGIYARLRQLDLDCGPYPFPGANCDAAPHPLGKVLTDG